MKAYILLLLAITVTSISLNCDSFINLSGPPIVLDVTGAKQPLHFDVTGLPQGVILKQNSLVATRAVSAGQYIISITVSDSQSQKDEKIIILNVDQGFKPISTTSLKSSSLINSTSQSNGIITLSSPLISTINQTTSFSNNFGDSSIGGTNDKLSTISNLQAFFNQIQSSNSSVQQNKQQIGSNSNNLADIINKFSATNSTSSNAIINTQSINSSVKYQTKSFVNLTLTDNQKQQILMNDNRTKQIFERQNLAAQWVSGNFSLVQQLTANKNFVNELITNITKQYQQDQQAFKLYESLVNEATNNSTQIQSAISNLNGYLLAYKNQQSNYSTTKIQLNDQLSSLISQNKQTVSQKVSIVQNIAVLNGQISNATSVLANTYSTCNNIQATAIDSNKTINIINSRIGLNQHQIQIGKAQATAQQAVIDDLNKKLNEAQLLLKQIKNNLTAAQQRGNNLNLQLAAQNQNFTNLNQHFASCQKNYALMQSNISTLQNSTLSSLNNQLDQLNKQNATQNNFIFSLNQQIASLNTKSNALTVQVNNAQSSLAILQTALPNVTKTLNELIKQKGQIESDLQNDQASLNAAIGRFKVQTKNLQTATMNLQNARAEQQLADRAVNQLLAEKTNVLPYAVAVNSTNALIGQTIVNPSVNISNWFNYISANFGSIALPYAKQDISCLYAFQPSFNLKNTVACPSDAVLTSFTGKIAQITKGNLIKVSDDSQNGAIRNIQIPDCARLMSNVPSYTFKVGDTVLIKAQIKSDSVNAKNIICLSE